MIIENYHLFADSDRTALICDDSRMSHRELWRRSEAVAYHLRENLINDKPIAIYGDKEADMVVAIFGALKAGKTYVVLPAAFPEERLRSILSFCQADCLFCPEGREFPSDLLLITSENVDEYVRRYDGRPHIDISAIPEDQTALIVYTSGSTGTPKGVEISHRNLSEWKRRVDSELQNFFDGIAYAELSFASYGVVMSLPMFYAIGNLGGTWISTRKLLDTALLLDLLKTHHVCNFGNTPTMIRQLLDMDDFNPANLPDLKRIVLAGEALPAATARRLIERFPDQVIMNKYGSTEVTASGFNCRMTPEALDSDALYCPVDDGTNTCGYLADAEGRRITAEGQTGEFIFCGDMVASGYHRDPDATQAKFFTLPDGTPAFRSGDLGIIRGGYTYMTGRGDNQVKIGGNRVELNEVEAKLQQCSIVSECAITAVADNGQNYLVGYVVLKPEAASLKQLQAFLQIKREMMQQTESYKIPEKIIFLDALPRNASNKIDRRLLSSLLDSKQQD